MRSNFGSIAGAIIVVLLIVGGIFYYVSQNNACNAVNGSLVRGAGFPPYVCVANPEKPRNG